MPGQPLPASWRSALVHSCYAAPTLTTAPLTPWFRNRQSLLLQTFDVKDDCLLDKRESLQPGVPNGDTSRHVGHMGAPTVLTVFENDGIAHR